MPTSITNHYKITGPVQFLDVHVDKDNRLFIDPSRIRAAATHRPGKYSKIADAQLTDHFDEILKCLRSSRARDHDYGERLMQRYHEPNETRLGMSMNGVRGRGGAEELGSYLWHELRKNPLCQAQVAILKRVEDIPIFVKGIDADITSDLTTRLIAPALASFTADMVKKHPEFVANGAVKGHEFETWSVANNQWETCTFNLPFVNGAALFLVPKDWVGPRLLMNYGQFYQVRLLGHVQQKRTVSVPGRKKPIRPTKKSLRTETSLTPSRETCVAQTRHIYDVDHVDILDAYRKNADDRAVPLIAEQIAKYLSR